MSSVVDAEPVAKKVKTDDAAATESNEAKPYEITKSDTIYFDPTSIGLPKGWSLTNYSDLKG